MRYGFIVVGYMVMPEHVHLLISEPERGTHSIVMQVLKQRFARRVLGEWRRRRKPDQGKLWEEALEAGHVWQAHFYDFVVRSELKKREKVRYCKLLSYLSLPSVANVKTWQFDPEPGGRTVLSVIYVYKIEGEQTPLPENPKIELDLPRFVRVTVRPFKPSCGDCAMHGGHVAK